MTNNTLHPTLMAFKAFGSFRGRAEKSGRLRLIRIGSGDASGEVGLDHIVICQITYAKLTWLTGPD